MPSARALAVAAALLAAGALRVAYEPATGGLEPEAAEVTFRPLAAGSTVGANSTNASASVVGTLLATTTDALWLNNTNATGVYYARIASHSTSGLANIVSLTIGISNGTASVPQVEGALGALTQSGGALVRLEPASANRIYVTRSVALVGPDTAVSFVAVLADDPTESASYAMRGSLTVT